MAENKKLNPEEIEAIEISIAAELTKNDDIVDFIQPNSLEQLKARYAAVEEDENIRNEGFEPIKKAGLIKKQRPESTAFDYFAAPVSPKDEIRTDVNSPLSQVFDSTKSEFDADTASFSDISASIAEVQPSYPEISSNEKESVPAIKASDIPTEYIGTVPPVAGIDNGTQTKEATATELPDLSKEHISGMAPLITNRYGYNTHTRVIYIDNTAEDGIQRNSEEALSSAFSDNSNQKRRFSLWTKKKK